MPDHSLSLLENALDSLTEALSKYEEGQNGEANAYKFAVLHMSHFFELILKHHIAQIHPLLIYCNPFSRTVDKSKTITLWDAVNFIENELPNKLEASFRSDLEWLKRLRNDIEHYRFSMDVSKVRATLGRLFRSLMDFIETHTEIDVESAIPAHVMATFTELSDEYKSDLRKAIDEATSIAEANEPDFRSGDDREVLFDCPECGNPTLVINSESETGFQCTLCDNRYSDELPVECESCGATTTIGEAVTWKNEMGMAETRCYYCSGRHHLDKDD